jgi:hypothetical protein
VEVLSMMRNPLRLQVRRASSGGYGLALMMAFIFSTVLVGASLQLVAGPTSMAFMGQASQDNLAARQVANLALDAARVDIQSKLNTGTTVDTSYRYPAAGTNSVTVPSYPGSGANTTVGTYYVTVTKARGNTYMLQANATSNGSTIQVSKLMQLGRNGFILDSISGVQAAYSLRRLRSGYTGKAIQVRRSSDNTTLDIGFTPAGDLDWAALEAFTGQSSDPLTGGDTDPPLDHLPAAGAAYSFRKLRSAYGGNCLRVERPDNSAWRDIGFSAGVVNEGFMDNFLGTQGGLTKWYDQSGNGPTMTQNVTSQEPLLYNGSHMIKINNRATANFSARGIDTNGGTANARTVSMVLKLVGSGAAETVYAMNGTAYYIRSNSAGGAYASTNPAATTLRVNGVVTNTHSNLFHIATVVLSSNENTTFSFGKVAAPNQLTSSWISEVIMFPTVLSASDISYLEKNQAKFYSITSASTSTAYISKWYDQSGNGNDAVQATAANQPTIVELGPGTTAIRPAIVFNGTSNFLRSATGMPTSSDYTKSVVATIADTTSANNFIGADSQHAFFMENTAFLRMYHVSTFATSGTAMDIDTPYAVMGTFVNSSKLGTVYQANTSVGSGTAGSVNTNATIQLGAWNSTYFLNGTESEALVFNRVLSSTERRTLYEDQQAYFGAL